MKLKQILSILITGVTIFWGLPVFAQGSDMLSMMGGGGGGMMGGNQYRDNKNPPNPNYTPNRSYSNEMEELKYEIWKTREELSDLFKFENPDQNQMNQKIIELKELESRRDEMMYNQ
jgi:hypothetical protein